MSQNVNSPLYTISVSTTSSTVTLSPIHMGVNSIMVTNEGAQSVFVFTSPAASTAVFPTTSATAFTNGSVVLPGQQVDLYKNADDGFVNLIRPAAATTANVYLDIGPNFSAN